MKLCNVRTTKSFEGGSPLVMMSSISSYGVHWHVTPFSPGKQCLRGKAVLKRKADN